MDAAALNKYIDSLFAAHAPNMVAEKLDDYRQLLMQDALEAINTRLVSLLSEDKQKELEVLLDTEPKEEQLTGFFEKNVPTVVAEVTAVLNEFKAGYMASFGSLSSLGSAADSSLGSVPPPAPAPVN